MQNKQDKNKQKETTTTTTAATTENTGSSYSRALLGKKRTLQKSR